MPVRLWGLAGLVLGLCLLGAVLSPRPGGAQGRPAQERPNVVVIETDDQTAASIEVMPLTRRLIGERGATFVNSLTSYPLCCPSRATFLTGQYATNHGVLNNDPPLGGFYRLNSDNTLAVWLRQAGYYTALIGKYLNGYGTVNPHQIPAGWTEWRALVDPNTYRYYGYDFNDQGAIHRYGRFSENPDAPLDPASYASDVTTEKAVRMIERRAPRRQPFFLWLGYLAPHGGGPTPAGSRCSSDAEPMNLAKPAARHFGAFESSPLPVPPSFNEPDVSDKPSFIRDIAPLDGTEMGRITRSYRCRLESLLAVDEAVGRVIAALRATGELDGTLVVFTSDNGFEQGEHRLATGKNRPYEESLRVPLLMRGPGIGRRVTVPELVMNADLAPTILDLTGARPGRRMDGISLLPLLAAPRTLHGREIFIQGRAGSGPWSGIRTWRYTFVQHDTNRDGTVDEEELYDLASDPYQLRSVHADPAYGRVRALLARRLALLRGCAGDACRTEPHLRLELRLRRARGGCPLGAVRLRVEGADRGRLDLVRFRLGGRLLRLDAHRPFAARVPAAALRGRPPRLRADALLLDGRRITLDRTVGIC
jgi:arylsulfatase A-like enzyme